MKKWVCSVCGYVHEGETAPEKCPICKAPADKFILQGDDLTWASEHVVGVGKAFGEDVPEEVRNEIIEGLRSNSTGRRGWTVSSSCTMWLPMMQVPSSMPLEVSTTS